MCEYTYVKTHFHCLDKKGSDRLTQQSCIQVHVGVYVFAITILVQEHCAVTVQPMVFSIKGILPHY